MFDLHAYIIDTAETKRLNKATEGLDSHTIAVRQITAMPNYTMGLVSGTTGERYVVTVQADGGHCDCKDGKYRIGKIINTKLLTGCYHAVALALAAQKQHPVHPVEVAVAAEQLAA